MQVAAGIALVALRGRDAALRADVLLGDPVELGHRDARLEPLLDSASVSATTRAGARPSARSRCGALADDHAAPRTLLERVLDLGVDLVDRAVGVERHELAGRRGSARRSARSPRGRSRAASRSPRACRRGGSPRAARASMPLGRDLVGQVEEEDRVERAADLARASRRAPRPAPRCAGSRRGRTRARASCSPSRSRISATVISSGTSSPAREDRLDLPARARCRAAIAARNMSPVEMCGIP